MAELNRRWERPEGKHLPPHLRMQQHIGHLDEAIQDAEKKLELSRHDISEMETGIIGHEGWQETEDEIALGHLHAGTMDNDTKKVVAKSMTDTDRAIAARIESLQELQKLVAALEAKITNLKIQRAAIVQPDLPHSIN